MIGLKQNERHSQIQQSTVLTYHTIATYVPPKICLSNATHMPISSCVDVKQLSQYLYSNQPTAINNVTASTAVHIFHIIGICP